VGPAGPTTPPPSAAPEVLVGAGDIARCGQERINADLTARLLDRIAGTVFTAGDNAYPSGRRGDFQNCYEPNWGRHKARTRPVPGNHDYETAGAADYYEYFGENAGPAGLGYYAYDVGAWRILAINSEISSAEGSAQLQWIRTQLQTNTRACTAAIWHRPLFTSGPNGDNRDMFDLWRLLYAFGVDVIINGHDHLYERFAKQDPDGRRDDVRGIRQFTVGTGGVPLYTAVRVKANSEVLETSTHGVLKLTLNGSSYHWEFVPVGDSGFRDSGSEGCH
jgi:3',5'-cyclic AMP phosphodiesterase CpdA